MRLGRVLFLILVPLASAIGQGNTGAVNGVAKSTEDGAPISFALVRLLPVDSASGGGQQGITSAQGRFQFSSVKPGAYRLQLLRIGFRPVTSPTLEVRPGETTEHELRGSMVGLPLPTVMVYADGTCLSGERVAHDPYLSALWEDVRQGVEIRRSFDQRYRYKRELAQTSETLVPSRPAMRRQRADTTTNEPDSALVREERVRAQRAKEGFGKGNSFTLPDERELLDDSFLGTHCIVPNVLGENGSTGVQFRQGSRGEGGFGLQGTIWVDATTRLMQRLELEHLDRDKPISQVTVRYADIAIAGTPLRLPTSGSFSAQLANAPRGTTAIGTLAFNYWGFEDVRPR